MRILLLNHNTAFGGGTFYRAFHAGRYLARRGHDVTLVTTAPHARWGVRHEAQDGVLIVETPDVLWGVGRTGWDLYNTLVRVALLRREQPDIIHAWDCRPVVIFPALALRWNRSGRSARLVIDWADWWGRGGTQAERPDGFAKRLYGPIETFFDEAFRTLGDGSTVASIALARRAAALGVSPATMVWLPGGSDVDTIRPTNRGAARLRLGLPREGTLVGFMGALTRSEAILLLKSVARARRQRPDLRLLTVGAVISGSRLSLRQWLGRRAPEWLLDVGRVPFRSVGDYLGACDVLVLPLMANISNAGRWPSKVNDYLAAGRPIVATDVGELTLLGAMRALLAVAPEVESFARSILRLIEDPSLAQPLAARARSLAEGPLNWTTNAARLETFYHHVIAGCPRDPADIWSRHHLFQQVGA